MNPGHSREESLLRLPGTRGELRCPRNDHQKAVPQPSSGGKVHANRILTTSPPPVLHVLWETSRWTGRMSMDGKIRTTETEPEPSARRVILRAVAGCVSDAQSAFAFSSQHAVENAKAHSTQQDERNALQVIENNQNRYAPLDTIRNARTTQNRNPQMVFRHGPSASLAIRRRLTFIRESSASLLAPPRAISAAPVHIIAGHKGLVALESLPYRQNGRRHAVTNQISCLSILASFLLLN